MQDQSLLLDGATMPWLGAVLEKNKMKNPDAPLLRTDYTKIRRAWGKALEKLKLSIKLAVLYQIRHNGPSWDIHTKHRTLPEVKKRGGWASDYTVKRYENRALVAVTFDRLPAEVKNQAIVAPQLLRARIA